MKAEAYVEVGKLIEEIRRCDRNIENLKVQRNEALEDLNTLLKANNRDMMTLDAIIKEDPIRIRNVRYRSRDELF